MQYRRGSIGAENAAEELTHDGDGTAAIAHELGEVGCLVDPPADAHAGERADGTSEIHRKHDAPFAVVVPVGDGPFAGDELDVVQHGLAIDRLSDVHPALPPRADRAVAE